MNRTVARRAFRSWGREGGSGGETVGVPSPPPRGCTGASRPGPPAPRRPHPPPGAPRRLSRPSRGVGIHHGAWAPSLPSPPGSSALLPGFASFAFPRLPAPRQSDLRTQPRQRLPPRRETPPSAALLGRGRAGAPAEGCRGEGGVPRAAEGLRWDLNLRPQILSGARVGCGGSTGRRSCAPEMEPLLGTRAPRHPFACAALPLARSQPSTGPSPEDPLPFRGPPQPRSPDRKSVV